jgi:peroxiredoxin
VQIVAVLASNDPFVMSAWGKANQVTGDDIVCDALLEGRWLANGVAAFSL